MSNGPRNMPRTWALQTAVLACVATVFFWLFYTFDFFTLGQSVGADGERRNVLDNFLAFAPESFNGIASLAGVNGAVFGIVITVISIIVQLSAERYTGVTRMFVRDRVNTFVIGFYVIACVTSVWLAASLQADFIPRSTLVAVLSITTGGLVIMAPFFGYVFWFLEPQNIIARIRRHAVKYAAKCAIDGEDVLVAQEQTLFALEELTDIANNSIAGRDKIIAGAAVDALKDLALGYMGWKPQAKPAWFLVGPNVRLNPDFVAMDDQSLADLETRKTWLEWQVMRQYLTIYNEALISMRDVNYLIAIDTRYIGEAAAKANDTELIALVYRFMNSYLRATLNAKDVRTTYNVLNQYRMLVEFMLENGRPREALDGVRFMKYYGLVGFEMKLNFVTETVAFDLAALTELANRQKSPSEADILADFLELDRPPFVRDQEKALMGVRKAQVKLAAYYLASGQEERARTIAADMRDEPMDRLHHIKRQLKSIENKDFWEIIDRGSNFEYMSEEQRACLDQFLEWVEAGSSEKREQVQDRK
ncbi:MAG: hypothetical protein K2X34_10170 [Hyphomonadaceae bacterium]|nr:hypothetical protein [Hyphomonadaceae bacterium]